jgi:thiol-disulfide isomerase/thioredoxin
MKYAILIVFFLMLSCKNEQKVTLVADAVYNSSNKIELEIYDYKGLEAFLNKKDDKVHVINFWATWCAPCVKELPFFEKLNEAYANRGVEVILVSLDFPKQYDSKLKPFIENKKLKSKVVAFNDTDSNYWIPKVSEEWTGAIPATLIYNKDKRQFYEKSFDYEELESQIKQFLNK